MEIEKIAADRYRLHSHNQLITLSAQDMRDVYDWCLLHMRELEQEAKPEPSYLDDPTRVSPGWLGDE